MSDSNLPVPNSHCEFFYRQTFNTYGLITTDGLTQNNRVGNLQKAANTRLTTNTNKGILAGSVVAVVGSNLIGPCAGGDSSSNDMAVGIAVNDAVGNPYESSSAVASQRVVYAHGSGTVFQTDIYETFADDGVTPVVYNAGDLLYSSINGLLTNASGLEASPVGSTLTVFQRYTVIGIVLVKPTATAPYMTVQMKL
jgi:hypothetical protein